MTQIAKKVWPELRVMINPNFADNMRQRKPNDPLDAGNGEEPPMELTERVTRIEALLPTLATKADLGELRTEMHREFNTQTWRFVTFVTTICMALTTAVYFIARNVH